MHVTLYVRTAIALLCLLVSNGAFGAGPRDGKTVVRTLSIDSGYVPPLTTNASMWNLWSELDGLGSGLFDIVSQQTVVGKGAVGRFIWGLAFPTLWIVPSYSFFVGNHELGHGSRGIATGLSATYTWNAGGFAHPTIFSFIGEGFIRLFDGAVTNIPGGAVRAYPADWDQVITMGGMNNSQMYGEFIADRASRGGGHFLEEIGYFWAKTDPLFYALRSQGGGTSDDVSNVLGYYNGRGFGVNSQDLIIGGAVSYLGSFTTYALLWSHLRYFVTGFGGVNGFRFGPVRAPDVAFFLNRDGPSYRVTSGLEFANFGIPISVEFIYKGNPTAEVSGGFSYAGRSGRKDLFLTRAYVNTQLGVGVEALKEIPFGK